MPRPSIFLSTATATLLSLTALQIQQVTAQADDVIWHNRYHALLAMGVYGDWQTLCPNQTFTQEGLLKNFPDSTADPWTVLDTWGPTEHGSEGFTAYIPEMDKVTLVFKGDYNLEKNLPIESADITDALDLGDACVDCKANAFALEGYLEAVQATNGFENAVAKWNEVGCYFSVTGHGLGGAHSLLATLHYNKMIEFSHNFGTPRVLNPAAANYYDYLLGGYQIDRGAANADSFMSLVPQSDDWAFTNTGIWYHGYNDTYKMNMESCIEQPEDAACLPQGDLNELDHYFYMSNVGQCGGAVRQDTSVAEAYIAAQQAKGTSIASVSGAAASTPTSSSSDGDDGSSNSTSTASASGRQIGTLSALNATSTATSTSSSSSGNAFLPSSIASASTSLAATSTASSASSLSSSSSSNSADANALQAANNANESTSATSGAITIKQGTLQAVLMACLAGSMSMVVMMTMSS